MKDNLKLVGHSIVGLSIYYLAFVKDIFAFEILAWTSLVLAFLGLCMSSVIKELADKVSWKSLIFIIPTTTLSLWMFFNYQAETFGYFYILFTVVESILILTEKLKNNESPIDKQ